MPSLIPGYEYDIFISYRQKDNKGDHWVTEFVKALKDELDTTFKEEISIYFDENPHDGLLETHQVDKSLVGKLRCLIFVPVLSRTYCDPKSYAWLNEFLPFCRLAREDSFGTDIRLSGGNVASRILPIQIHELDHKDQTLFEQEVGPLRSIDFTFKTPGVNRPLTPVDTRAENLKKTIYRDQVNKAANAIGEIIKSMTGKGTLPVEQPSAKGLTEKPGFTQVWNEIQRRHVIRASVSYLVVALLVHQFLLYLTPILKLEERYADLAAMFLLAGFPLAVLFAWFFEVSPHGFIRTNSDESTTNTYPPYRKKPLTSTPVVTVLIIALVFQYVYLNYVKSPLFNPVADAMGNKIISIAVLPFENRSGDDNDRYIADGITDDVINRLTIISQLKVTNRSTTQQYSGNIISYDDIASDLQVMTLLIGSIQRFGTNIVIRAQLIEGKTNRFIWGNTFHRTTENIMVVQSEIAQVIADHLKIELNDLEKVRLKLPPTENPTAYDYYLKGRSYYYKYEAVANDSAVKQFKRAIALDPGYARSWAGLGDAYSQMNMRFSRDVTWLDSSLVAGMKAIELDSNLSEAYKALANAYNYKTNYREAFPLLKKAVELSPTNEQAVGNLGTNYLLRGDLPNALRWEKKAVGLNPKNWIPYQIIGWIYRLLGDLEQAESWLSKSLEINPKVFDTYELLAYTYTAQGRNKDALNLIPKVLEISNDEPRPLEIAGLIANFAGDYQEAKNYFQRSINNNPSYKNDPNTVSAIGLGQILLRDGKKIEAEVYLSHALEVNLEEIKKGSQSYEPAFYVAAIYAIRKNTEQSLFWLQKSLDATWIDYAQVVHGPYFVLQKDDPAFMQKVKSARLRADSLRKIAAQY